MPKQSNMKNEVLLKRRSFYDKKEREKEKRSYKKIKFFIKKISQMYNENWPVEK